ncbi:sigma-54 dependent transcriptional regulator [Marinobacter hydrocarbonoclasticus]|nr:sigma-54 dependent transcriptional regulator [Marinobacter nauticus]
MTTKAHSHEVLLVEDSQSIASLYKAYLRDEPLSLKHVTSVADARACLEHRLPALVLLDLNLPDESGGQVLRWIHDRGLTLPVVVITGHGSVEHAVEAMRLGAYDFVTKPVEPARLKTTVHNALQFHALNAQLEAYQMPEKRQGFCGFVGASAVMQGVYRALEQAASSQAPVFVQGESGTGKELCAEALHLSSPRSEGPLIAVNCAAIPKDLFESELFGHVKGAFTGASKDRIGAVRQAHGGTLFLDEICEMPMDLQSKLLRFLQTGQVSAVGSDRIDTVDVRIVCATNRDPWEEVDAGRFREDLYYRLYVVPIVVPPLRQRGDDVLLLARRFLKHYGKEEGKAFAGFSAEAESLLKRYPWPGNVRQLQNVVRQICVMNPGGKIGKERIPPLPKRSMAGLVAATPVESQPIAEVPQIPPQQGQPAPEAGQEPELIPLATMERQLIERAIDACEGNVTRAASLLDVSPSTIYRKLQAWQGQ